LEFRLAESSAAAEEVLFGRPVLFRPWITKLPPQMLPIHLAKNDPCGRPNKHILPGSLTWRVDPAKSKNKHMGQPYKAVASEPNQGVQSEFQRMASPLHPLPSTALPKSPLQLQHLKCPSCADTFSHLIFCTDFYGWRVAVRRKSKVPDGLGWMLPRRRLWTMTESRYQRLREGRSRAASCWMLV